MGDISVDPKGAFDFVIKGDTQCQGVPCYVLEGKPRESGHVYSKKVVHIRKDNFFNVYTEYYNQANQLEKVMNVSGLHQNAEKKWSAESVEMKNLLTQHRTVIQYENRNLSKVPANRYFSKSFLSK